VVIVAEAVGTHVGTIMGLEPSGRRFRFALTFVLEVEEGAIVRERRIYDFTGLLVQIGVLKAKPA
jgi:predicted ester cyclase